ncbi:MAG TPA: rhodanese-like domain-containing protein [Pyrinomonadaceae bacterium]|nr:rhodanese-like domain-containing protein [Pyrinomonadaceae bacterium]
MQTTTEASRATHIESPEKRKLMPLAGNAFRALGLSCHASQKEIYAAASSIRRAIKLGVERTHDAHHFAWLGSPDRTENGVRDALSRLSDPAQRIYERFFWFFDPQEAATTASELGFATLEQSIERLRGGAQASAPHDIALLSLAALLELDPLLLLAEDWRRTYALWKEVIETKEFWSLLMAADLKGDFEQVTTFGEIKALRMRAWRLVTSPVAEIAKDGILRDDQELSRRALDTLRLPVLPPTLAHEYENEILGPVEDKFDALFAEAFRVYRYEVKTDQTLAERRATCQSALEKFDSQVKPALKNIFELAGVESLSTRRVFQTAADGLDELADGFETAFETAARLKMLRRAWLLAPPESASLLLIEEHLKAAGDVQERPVKTDADYARQIALALREPIAPPELFTSYIQKEKSAKKFEGCGDLVGKIVVFLMLSLFVGKCFNSLPGSRRTRFQPPPINFNVAIPRFTPSPMPTIDASSFVLRISARHLQAKLILKTAVVLDVGTKNEYDAGHIPGAISIPASELAARAGRLPKSKQIVLYCYCSRQDVSALAALQLQEKGFYNVAILEGGYQAWLDAGLPVKQTK